MLRLCLLQYIYGDSDRQVVENAKLNLGYKYFLGMAIDEEPPDDSTVSYFRAIRLDEDKFRQVFQNIVQQCIDKGLVTGKRQRIDSTHIMADIAINSLSGLIKLCRRNVLKTVDKQDSKIAGKHWPKSTNSAIATGLPPYLGHWAGNHLRNKLAAQVVLFPFNIDSVFYEPFYLIIT